MNGKIILSLDASTTAVGWCLAQGEKYLDSGTYQPPGQNAGERIRAVANWVVNQIFDHDPDLIAVEEPTGDHANRHTDRLLARVCGAIEGVCALMKVEVLLVHPLKVKATPFHKDATQAAASHVGKRSVTGDEADAMGAWQATLGILQARRFEEMIGGE